MIVLTVIVVTWNNANTIEACLGSVPSYADGGEVETIVVDNHSSDRTADIVARHFPTVTLVRGAENLGYARANNLAMGKASAETLLLLNPDAILCEPDSISRMLGVLVSEETIGAVGCRLVFPNMRHQVGDAGFRPSPANMIVHGLGLAHGVPGLKTLYLVRPDRLRAKIVDTDWVCGACLMVRLAVAKACGGLDETLFLYAEDIAFGCAIRDLGYRVVYLPSTRVIHLQGASEAQAATERVSTRWLEALLNLYSRLNAGRWHRTVCLAFAAGFLARATVYALISLVLAGYWRRATALWHYAGVAFRSRQDIGVAGG